MEYILIFIAAVFVNNVVLAQFLGICPFLGVSKKVETAAGMGAAVTFVLTIATIVTFLVQKYILDAFGLGFMQTISFILIIAALVQMVEIILKKVSPALICYLDRYWICASFDYLRGYSGATSHDACSGRHERHSYRLDNGRFASYGFYGILGYRITNLSK